MSEEKSFDQLIDESMKTIRTGEIVEGTVIDVKPDEIVLNIGYKSDGIISKEEYSNDSTVELDKVVAVGDTMEAKVLKVNDGDGQVQLSYKRISEEKANKRLEEAFENEEVLTVKVDQVTNGGLITTFEEGKIFVPASLVSDIFEKDLTKYQDQEIEVVITEFNPRKRRIIGNRRKLLQATREERAKELFETLQVNDIVEGTVKSVTNFGAFVDLGGIDGLLHISEMSWGRVNSPKQIVKVADKIRVYIKDMAEGKIALSAKFPDENPWVLAREKYEAGSIVTGKVARMADFGAFIELEPGIDALLHVSQISKKHVKKPSDVLKIGQVIDAKVVEFKEEEKKISLSRRDFEDDLVPDDLYADEGKAEEKVEEAAPAEEVVEAAPAEEAVEAAPAEEAVEAAEEKIEEAAEAAEEKVEEAAETAEAVAEEAVEEEVEEAVADAETEIEETVKEAEEAVEEAPTEEAVEEAVAEAEEKIEEAAAEAEEKIEDAASEE